MDFDEVIEKKRVVEEEIGRLITEFGKETEMLITKVDLFSRNYIKDGARYMLFNYHVSLNVRF